MFIPIVFAYSGLLPSLPYPGNVDSSMCTGDGSRSAGSGHKPGWTNLFLTLPFGMLWIITILVYHSSNNPEIALITQL
jgi:hypothetical protein